MRKQALQSITELADKDERVVFIGSDLSPGIMAEFKERHPDRFFMEGVSEQHIIGMAAGMAMEGFIPYVNTIATFLTRRCFEQIAMDVCLHNLPIRLIANGGGMVYAPLGPTHQSVDDFALMRALPNMTVTAPIDANEMAALIEASLDYPNPLYVRLGKGGDPIVTKAGLPFKFGQPVVLATGSQVALISTGIASAIALDAAKALSRDGISARVVHLPTIKPLHATELLKLLDGVSIALIVEEHLATGGLSSAIAELIMFCDVPLVARIISVSLGETYAHEYGVQLNHLEAAGISPEGIRQICRQEMTKVGAK